MRGKERTVGRVRLPFPASRALPCSTLLCTDNTASPHRAQHHDRIVFMSWQKDLQKLFVSYLPKKDDPRLPFLRVFDPHDGAKTDGTRGSFNVLHDIPIGSAAIASSQWSKERGQKGMPPKVSAVCIEFLTGLDILAVSTDDFSLGFWDVSCYRVGTGSPRILSRLHTPK